VLLLDRAADAFIARRAGADAHVLKPINAAELRQAVAPEPTTAAAGEEE
jgi:CheY-like chemotaxis protein